MSISIVTTQRHASSHFEGRRFPDVGSAIHPSRCIPEPIFSHAQSGEQSAPKGEEEAERRMGGGSSISDTASILEAFPFWSPVQVCVVSLTPFQVSTCVHCIGWLRRCCCLGLHVMMSMQADLRCERRLASGRVFRCGGGHWEAAVGRPLLDHAHPRHVCPHPKTGVDPDGPDAAAGGAGADSHLRGKEVGDKGWDEQQLIRLHRVLARLLPIFTPLTL